MVKQKFKEWIKRYFVAELVGTATAVGAASITHLFSKSYIFNAYAGSVGEAVGFYLTIIIQNIVSVNKLNTTENKTMHFSSLSKIIAGMFLEFGPSGMIDGLFIRPFFMCLFPVLLKNFTLGILTGKIAGDFTFYLLVILSYEMKKKYKRNIIVK
jgi:hypothetical protein